MHQPPISIPLGIVLGLLASFVQSLGLTIQRKSHVINQVLPEHQQRVEHRRPLWLLGFAVFISSNVLGSLVQIVSLPVVILAPLGAVSLLWNAFFARFILGDIFSPWMVLGTILIAGGATLIAVFGIVPEPTRSLEDLLELFRRPVFVLYFSTLGVGLFGCLVITHIADYYSSQNLARLRLTFLPSSTPRSATPISSTPSSGFAAPASESMMAGAAISTERTPLLDPKSVQSSLVSLHRYPTDPSVHSIHRMRLLLAVAYASFSGVISGMCLLFAKSGVELLLLTLTGQNQFWRWQAWILVLGLVVFALLQLWYLHKALVLADPTLVCPLAFCFYNLSSIVNGLVYFDQFSLIPPLHLGLIVLGIFTLLGGVWVVTIQSGGKNPYIDRKNNGFNDDLCDGIDNIEDGSQVNFDGSSMEGSDATTPPPRGSILTEVETLPDLIRVPSAAVDTVEQDFNPSFVLSPTFEQTSWSPESQHRLPRRNSQSARLLSPSLKTSQRRKSTVHASNGPSSSQHSHRTPSFNHASYAQISPPGFQIGLSPLSPGFAVVPRERGRRSSELGIGNGSVSADVVIDGNEAQRELQRRRTVSEGDSRTTMSVLSHSRRDSEHDEDLRSLEDLVEGAAGGDSQNTSTRDKGKARDGKARWQWLRKVFHGR